MIFKVDVTTELLIELYSSLENLLPWQSRWYQHRFDKFRFLHKGRQIGASDYFSLEALLDACLTGENKTFITQSPTDDEEFQSSELFYLARHAGISKTISGNEKTIYLSNGAKIHFISDKDKLPDDCGDVYLSEWAWFSHPKRVLEMAKVMNATCGVLVINDNDVSGEEFRMLREGLNKAHNEGSFRNLFVYGATENRNIDVIPLSRISDKGRITLYSSRVTGDSGFQIDREQMFNGFYDVVPNVTIEVGHNLVTEQKRREWLKYGNKMFNELFLCKLPTTSRVRQPPKKP
ncbi:terminase large subunit domain-containing protein [Providencia sp. 2024EL-00606]|uniref:terminase large subunit domain-containing protein n=1 Tax=Providencia sp. 2024EL-00606 TaxID=3350765 RepID=UPI0024AB8111|nr:terminase family protein [Providencia rettgeri]MDX4118420.1 terminase family protein [Providencia rettgeri]